MAQTFLIFDFGTNEEAAQQARHSIERWKQGFRLDKKMLLKFDREESAEAAEEAEEKEGADSSEKGGAEKAGATRPKKGAKSGGKTGTKEAPENGERIVLIVRLDFSDHEKLSQQRWLDRLPSEPGFKEAHPRVIRPDDAGFDEMEERFERLD